MKGLNHEIPLYVTSSVFDLLFFLVRKSTESLLTLIYRNNYNILLNFRSAHQDHSRMPN